MADAKSEFKEIVAKAVNQFIKEKGIEVPEVTAESIVVQNAPNPEMGDLGSPMFAFAKSLRMAPPQIASGVAEIAASLPNADSLGKIIAVGPYVNIKLDKAGAAAPILKAVKTQGEAYGSFNQAGKKPLEGRKVMIEF